jgi:hypothetical protein
MQGEDCDEIFERGVEVFGVAFPDVHEMEVVVGENGCEFGANHQAVAMADEDGFDFGEFLDGFGFGGLHQF